MLSAGVEIRLIDCYYSAIIIIVECLLLLIRYGNSLYCVLLIFAFAFVYCIFVFIYFFCGYCHYLDMDNLMNKDVYIIISAGG